MAKPATPHARLADAAFRLLAKQRWNELTLAAVARSAKLPLVELHAIAPSKPMLIGLMLTRAGEETARRYKADNESQSDRDRIFDVALTWFETLNPRKPALRALHDGLRRDPLALLAARGAFVGAAEWLLALAEADSGRALHLKAAALAALLVRALPVWLEDDKDMSKTMAQLDGDLRRGGMLFRTGNTASK
jgi:AcrR family transcriptional regulator